MLTTTPSKNRPMLRRKGSPAAIVQTALDGACAIAVVYFSVTYKIGFFTYPYLFLLLLLLVAMGLVYDRFGVYSLQHRVMSKSVSLIKAWTVVFLILGIIGFLTKTSDMFSRQVLIFIFVAGLLSQWICHLIGYWIQTKRRENLSHSKSLIIGAGQLARFLHSKINENPWLNEEVIGLICLDDRELEILGSSSSDNINILGDLSNIAELVENKQIDTVYFAISLDAAPVIEATYHYLLDKNINIHWAPNIFALNLINHSVSEISGIPLITLSETPLTGSNLLAKTLLDKSAAIVALALLSPIMLATALVIKTTSPGPILFRRKRTGWNGEEFDIYKFRSMYAEGTEPSYVPQATRDDPRITAVGRFIRRTSIDELPQLFNVLNGTMSLVGPRPHALSHNDDYSKRISNYLTRLRIKPGITGLAQVRGYRGETKELDRMVKRVESDIEYINNWSIVLDISIIFRTVFTLFSKEAY
jgi:putative colanic acid biosynthesis UDP-glucose lipid carrier transferase